MTGLDPISTRGVEARNDRVFARRTRVSESPSDAPTPASTERPRSPLGRRFAAVTTTILTSLLIWHAAGAIYRDSFTEVAPSPEDTRCADSIRGLHTAYGAAWAARTDTTALDRRLEGLRGLCAREGPDAAAAWRHLERWRYRAESHAEFGRELLDEDARLALAYQSPGTSR